MLMNLMVKQLIPILMLLLIAGCGNKIPMQSIESEPLVKIQQGDMYFKNIKITNYSSDYIAHGDTIYRLKSEKGTQIIYLTSTRGNPCGSYYHNISIEFPDIDFIDPNCGGSVQNIKSKLT